MEAATDEDLHKIIWTMFSRSQVLAGHSRHVNYQQSLELEVKKHKADEKE